MWLENCQVMGRTFSSLPFQHKSFWFPSKRNKIICMLTQCRCYLTSEGDHHSSLFCLASRFVCSWLLKFISASRFLFLCLILHSDWWTHRTSHFHCAVAGGVWFVSTMAQQSMYFRQADTCVKILYSALDRKIQPMSCFLAPHQSLTHRPLLGDQLLGNYLIAVNHTAACECAANSFRVVLITTKIRSNWGTEFWPTQPPNDGGICFRVVGAACWHHRTDLSCPRRGQWHPLPSTPCSWKVTCSHSDWRRALDFAVAVKTWENIQIGIAQHPEGLSNQDLLHHLPQRLLGG